MSSDKHSFRTLALVIALGSLVDCKCIEHPLYDAGVNRFDTWYLGGGNSQYRPFRRGELDDVGELDVEVVLARDTDGRPVVRTLVLDAIDRESVSGQVFVGDAVFELVPTGDEQLATRLDPDAVADMRVRLDDGHGGIVEIAVPAAELREALAELPAEELQP